MIQWVEDWGIEGLRGSFLGGMGLVLVRFSFSMEIESLILISCLSRRYDEYGNYFLIFVKQNN